MTKPTTEPVTPVAEVIADKNKKTKKRGNKPGFNGRKGYKAPQTLERLASKKLMVQRIVKATDSLLNAHLNKARGEQFLMHRYYTGSGAKRKVHVDVVTDLELIKEYVTDDGETLNSMGDDGEYYYISVKPADHNSLANLLDRAYGRPTEKVELGPQDDGDLAELSDEELDKRLDVYIQKRRGA